MGTFNISGSTSGGLNIRTFTIPLSKVPDMCDVFYKGPNGSPSPRLSSEWFTDDYVTVVGNGGIVTNEPTQWYLSYKIENGNLVITAQYSQGFTDTITLVSTQVSYKLVDYSVLL